MSATPPVILFNNLLHLHPVLAASSTKVGSSVDFIRDWREGLRWEADFDAVPPDTETVDVFPANGQLIPRNWYFRDWSLGVADVPDAWVLDDGGSASASVQQHSGADRFIHDFSAQVTAAGGNDARLFQAMLQPELLRGKRIRAGAHVWTSVAADAARIELDDGTTTVVSSYHSGGGGREWLTTPVLTVGPLAQSIRVSLWMRNNNGTARFDGPLVVQDSAAPVETPHAATIDAMGFFDHNFGTANLSIRALGSDDNFTTTPDVIGPTAPANDLAFITRLAGGSTFTRRFWRLEFAPTTDSQSPICGAALLGSALDFPGPIVPGFAPLDRMLESRLPSNQDGAPLQRALNRTPLDLQLIQEWVDDTDITGSLAAFLDHAYGPGPGLVSSEGGLPFLLQPIPADRPSLVFWSWVAEQSRFQAPLAHALRANPVTLDLKALR